MQRERSLAKKSQACCIVLASSGALHFHSQQMGGGEARIDGEEMLHATYQQACPHQQHRGQRDFDGD